MVNLLEDGKHPARTGTPRGESERGVEIDDEHFAAPIDEDIVPLPEVNVHDAARVDFRDESSESLK